MPKTGTSYIQKFLRENKDVLKSKGYAFPISFKVPNVLPQRNARFLVHVYKDENGKTDKKKANEVWNKYFDKISNLFTQHDNIILSEEGIWNLNKKNNPFWKKFKNELDKRNIDCKIIAYLRRQDLFAQSHWAQVVQEYEQCDFKKYIESVGHDRLDYYTRLNDIAKFMGKENIIVRVYEKQQWGGTDNTLISDFFDAVGLELTEDFVPPEQDVVNISLSGKYLEFKRYMNRYPERQTSNYKKDCLYSLLTELTLRNAKTSNYRKNVYLNYDETLAFLDKFKEQNSSVAKEYLGREDGILFRDEILNEKSNEHYTLEDYLDVANEVISLQDEKVTDLKGQVKELNKELEKLQKMYDRKGTFEYYRDGIKWRVKRFFKNIFGLNKKTDETSDEQEGEQNSENTENQANQVEKQ